MDRTKVSLINRFSAGLLEKLDSLPIELDYQPDILPELVPEAIKNTDILIFKSKIDLDQAMIERLPQLKLVVRAGVGLDHIDLAYAANQSIIVKNTPGGNADSVAEHTIGMLLMLKHWIARASQEVKQFKWLREKNRGTEIKGKTVGIIGFGNTGSRVAKRLVSFGCEILAYDKYKSGFGDLTIKEVPLETIFERADIISLHVPLTEETKYWVDGHFFAKCKRPITLLNLARGPVVRIEGLLEALNSGKVIAAGIDVLENEDFTSLSERQRALYEDLFQRENVALSPHIGGWSIESERNIWEMIYGYVEAFILKQQSE